ncbi:helix-turn-helix domain-containing protein [Granulicella sp. 5B5]|uniref:helix-turn-helix domain-containing protein n=1 Tax=Granulicella sp. 5B5 TaxID=1617967 RepID=UPI0015F41679|nr:helix-turn-helix transcriptional regulator [Granulicella sp. 5B5]QMV19660.1 helix-turn-helix domain-containing protein [Granulicella sp. 5B5]
MKSFHEFSTDFGAWLREARKAKKLSMTELGLQMGGFHRNTILRWEMGSTLPDVREYALLQQVLEAKFEGIA